MPCFTVNKDFTILIVEDGENDGLLLKRALKREDITNPIQVVHDGQQAIDYLCGKEPYSDRQQYPFPKAIFCDIKMPHLGGFDVLQWLRNNPDCSVMPLIILSASKLDEDIKRAYQMGANAYLAKPHDIQELQQMVKTAFEFWAGCEIPRVGGKCCC